MSRARMERRATWKRLERVHNSICRRMGLPRKFVPKVTGVEFTLPEGGPISVDVSYIVSPPDGLRAVMEIGGGQSAGLDRIFAGLLGENGSQHGSHAQREP